MSKFTKQELKEMFKETIKEYVINETKRSLPVKKVLATSKKSGYPFKASGGKGEFMGEEPKLSFKPVKKKLVTKSSIKKPTNSKDYQK